jgi:hypothetical protein
LQFVLLLFNGAWLELTHRLKSGMKIPYWGITAGKDDTFAITEVDHRWVVVLPKQGQLRRISRDDFHKIFVPWEPYKRGEMSREKLTEMSRNSSYTLSIFHWLEDSEVAATGSPNETAGAP